MLTQEQLELFHSVGHVTIERVLTAEQLSTAKQDIEHWSAEFLQTMEEDQKQWYLENRGQASLLRKLDNPVFHRPFYRALACGTQIAELVAPILGSAVTAFFSQVFCKPPSIGGPKPVHQDNFYFDPDNEDATLTVWIAIDDATEENGCLFYGDGSHQCGILPHSAPIDEPYNLQVDQSASRNVEMTAAPVAAGGVSIHHGNTLHQSGPNRSTCSRRAVAIHYLAQSARLVAPGLTYDESVFVKCDFADQS